MKFPTSSKQPNSKCPWSARLVAMACFVFSCCTLAAEAANTPAELYAVQLKNVVIPRELLTSVVSEKGKKAALVDSCLYVEVKRNGDLCWRSPGMKIEEKGKQERFDFPQEDENRGTAFALMWKPGDNIQVQVKVAEEKALVKASTAGAGGVGGALAGAGAGAIAAGVCSGGLGAPAGAVIGGIIGFFGGAGLGALVPVTGEREIVSFPLSGPAFGLNGILEENLAERGDVLLNGIAKAEFSGKRRTDAVPSGKLELQKTYVVRLRNVYLSDKANECKDNADYYMAIALAGVEKEVKVPLGKIDRNTVTPFEKTFVFKNVGGTSSVEIRRKKWGRDAVVFKAYQGQTGGTSWIFCGKAGDEQGSFVEFETFPTEE